MLTFQRVTLLRFALRPLECNTDLYPVFSSSLVWSKENQHVFCFLADYPFGCLKVSLEFLFLSQELQNLQRNSSDIGLSEKQRTNIFTVSSDSSCPHPNRGMFQICFG